MVSILFLREGVSNYEMYVLVFLIFDTRYRKSKGQSIMYNPETLAILGTQETGKRQIKKPQHRKLNR